MLFYLIIVSISFITALLPVILNMTKRYWPALALHRANSFLPVLAGVVFFVSFFLPDVHISAETNTFQQHFVGGGVYAALLYYYIRQLIIGRRIKWWQDVALLFMWVSTLGVASELLEFFLLKFHILYIDTTDTQWDLLANTLGAFVIFCLANALRKR